MVDKTEQWLAPPNATIPDFIICGAMKSGTSTIHSILNEHPNVYIPKGEIHFFDIDNIFQHSDFNFYIKERDEWITQQLNSNYEKMWKWYSSHFPVDSKLIIGEDSTTYLASRRAAKRISIQNKKIKLVIILRHPTKRAYSQYYHMLRTGRSTYSFEDTIRFNPFSILNRSMYLEQIENYYRFISKEQIKVVVFENFLKNKKTVMKNICEFIGIDFDLLPDEALNLHSNQARLPKYPQLQILKNKLLPDGSRYSNSLPNTLPAEIRNRWSPTDILNKIHNVINPQSKITPPKMKQATETFLDIFFENELNGINEIVGEDILSYWFKTNSNVK